MNRQILQAARQVVYSALTPVGGLPYQIDGTNAPSNLPIANVVPKAVWLAGGAAAPMPLVAFDLGAGVSEPRVFNVRRLNLKVWVVSENGQDECVGLYEAVRGRLHLADQESVPDGPQDLSRAGSGSALAITVREFVETRASGADYERETNRWYLVAEYRITAS